MFISRMRRTLNRPPTLDQRSVSESGQSVGQAGVIGRHLYRRRMAGCRNATDRAFSANRARMRTYQRRTEGSETSTHAHSPPPPRVRLIAVHGVFLCVIPHETRTGFAERGARCAENGARLAASRSNRRTPQRQNSKERKSKVEKGPPASLGLRAGRTVNGPSHPLRRVPRRSAATRRVRRAL